MPVGSIGDPSKIVSVTTRITDDPTELKIAATAARVMEASGLLVDGFSCQTGDAAMRDKAVVGSFAAGGNTGGIVSMFRQGLFRALFYGQCFDLTAVASYRNETRGTCRCQRRSTPIQPPRGLW